MARVLAFYPNPYFRGAPNPTLGLITPSLGRRIILDELFAFVGEPALVDGVAIKVTCFP
jgi:hypothetical protein